MSFKLLAIRPLDECNPKFLKNLEENRIYQFYNDYEFLDKDKKIIKDFGKNNYIEVDSIKYTSTVPDNLYGDKINISAIVGKNGSGKSALIELFVVCVNELSFHLKKKNKITTDARIESTNPIKNKKIQTEIYFENNGKYLRLKIKDNELIELYNLTDKDFLNSDILKNFFYTLIVNYSIYSFNPYVLSDEDELGVFSNLWIEGLFHKNDSYQIPVVINPKRESVYEKYGGAIDINNEQDLLQQRLLFNVLKYFDKDYRDHLKMGDNRLAIVILHKIKPFYEISKFNNLNSEIDKILDPRFFWKDYKNNNFGIQINNRKNGDIPSIYFGYSAIIEKVFKKFNLTLISTNNIYKCYEYIVYKIFSICERYSDYKVYLNWNEKGVYGIDIEKFLLFISDINNRSHITNKLMQVINYIKFYDSLWYKYDQEEINIISLSTELNKITDVQHPLIEILPPSIFKIKIATEEIVEYPRKKNRITIDKLSSGEQQLIHTTSTIIYHLNNLNSVVQTDLIVKYDYINFIFDELELYFHPEFQRKLLKYLLEAIKNANLDKIKAINILFITHSPFILSDIPKQNVLFLEVDDKSKKAIPKPYKGENTFGANIHEMLTDGFFISSTKGEFVLSKINEFLKDYKKWISADKENTEYSNYKNDYNNKNRYYKDFILLIGEDYVRVMLQNHYRALQEHFEDISPLESRKKFLQEEKQRIEAKLEDIDQ